MRSDAGRVASLVVKVGFYAVVLMTAFAMGASIQGRQHRHDMKIREENKRLTIFETLLVNEKGDAVSATFTVKSDDVIYFIVSDRWQMCAPRSN